MPDIQYPYLEEGTVFDAASLNNRLQTVTDGLNGLTEVSVQRGTFSDQHLTNQGLLAGEQFPTIATAGTTRYSRNISGNHSYTVQYVSWGGNGTYPAVGDNDRELITDGVVSLEINFGASSIQLGMSNTDKIAGLIILLNVHLLRTSVVDAQQQTDYGAEQSAMTCIQYTTDGINWFTFRKTERFQRNRTVRGEGQGAQIDPSPRGRMTGADQDDVYCNQDIATRTLILPEDLPDPNLAIRGIRAATAVWQPATGSAQTIYLREANFTVIPLHAGN
tara:strand:+ start:741 stop:1568 length:828 start_codon:yes stop_codon:yes gene_type:complete